MNNLMNFLLHGWRWTGDIRQDSVNGKWNAGIVHRNPARMWTDAEGIDED